MPAGLPFHIKDYLDLVDWTGRIIRGDKRGAIDEALPPIMERLDIELQHGCIWPRSSKAGLKPLPVRQPIRTSILPTDQISHQAIK